MMNALHNRRRISVHCREHICIEISDPQFAFLSNAKVAQGALDIRAYDVPIEFCVSLTQVARRLVSELLVQADLLELIKEGIAPQNAIRSFQSSLIIFSKVSNKGGM
jgi:hypothetical protein